MQMAAMNETGWHSNALDAQRVRLHPGSTTLPAAVTRRRDKMTSRSPPHWREAPTPVDARTARPATSNDKNGTWVEPGAVQKTSPTARSEP